MFGNPNLLGTGNFPPLGYGQENLLTSQFGTVVFVDLPPHTGPNLVLELGIFQQAQIRISASSTKDYYSVAWSDSNGLITQVFTAVDGSSSQVIPTNQSFAVCFYFAVPKYYPNIDYNCFTSAVDEATFITAAANSLHLDSRNAAFCLSMDAFRPPPTKSSLLAPYEPISYSDIQQILNQ